MTHSFIAYIDESGDEGFSFATAGTGGSSRWFVLAAAVFVVDTESDDVRCVDAAKGALNRDLSKPLHFRDLSHDSRVVYVQAVAKARMKIVSAIVYKPEVPGRLKTKSWLYHWSSRLVLERISWLCGARFRDRDRPVPGNGKVQIIFSHRRSTSYEDFKQYLKRLRDDGNTTIDWAVVDPDLIQSLRHRERRGLQVADAVASAFFCSVEQNRHGNTEERYAEWLMPKIFTGDNGSTYGLKIYPSTSIEPFRRANTLLD